MEDPTLDLSRVEQAPTELPASAPQRGDTVGRYMVVDLLGMGGMGIVYKAFDPVLNRAIALKVLLLGNERKGGEDSFDQRKTRALREAQALAQLTHPNVVAIYDVGTQDDRLFMAMELIDGVTLGSYLKDKQDGKDAGTSSQAQILAVLIAAGHGLSAAHKLGIIHRDFKPANVLLGKDGRVRVIDFGLARADDHGAELPAPGPLPLPLDARLSSQSGNLLSSDMTQQGLVLGTPMYMAPEQQAGLPLDATADQFSFAVVLWEALYGQRPFAGDTVEEVAANARQRRVRRPASAHVPQWLDAIVTRALSPDPKARFASMDELLFALGDDPERRRAKVRAQRLRLLGVALAGIVIAGSLFLAWRGHQHAAQICRGADDKLAGIWDDAKSATVHKAFLATQRSFAPHAFAKVKTTLDAYASAWAAMHTEACLASSVRHEQSTEIMTLRMNCLAHRLGELKAAASLLGTADVSLVRKAHEIAEQLTPIAGCGDVEALTAPLAPPRDQATRAKVERLRDDLAQAKVLEDAGKFAVALGIAEGAAKQAAETGYSPLEAEAQLRRGSLLNALGRYEESATTLRAAFLAALGSRHASVALRAACELIVVQSLGLSRPAEAESWGQLGRAVLQSAPDPEAEARWLNAMGVLYLNLGKYDQAYDHLTRGLAIRERLTGPGAQRAVGTSLLDLGVVCDERGEHEQARAHYLRALAIWEKEVGADHPSVAPIVNNLGILAWEHGDYAAAETYYRRAMKIEADAFGVDAEPPSTGLMLVNLALVHHDAGREVEALDYYRRALATTEKQLGKTHPMVIWSLQGLGRIAAKRQQLDEARAHFERVLTICGAEQCRGEEKHALAESEFGLAQLLARGKRADKRARTLAEEARGFLQQIKSVGAKRRLAEVEAWLRAQGA